MACPICKKPADQAFRPFCSQRCKQVDLNRWLSGVYVVPGDPQEDAKKNEEDAGQNEDI